MALEAFTLYAPTAVLTTVNGTTDPARAAALRRIAARPTSLKKVPSTIVLDVITDVDDPATLNELIAVGDGRVGVRKALSNHRLAARAMALRTQPHRDLVGVEPCTLHADAVISRIAQEHLDRWKAGLVEWVRTLPLEQRADAVATIITAYIREGHPRASALAPIALDVIIGRVDRFSSQDWDTIVHQRYDERVNGCVANAALALDELHHLDAGETRHLANSGLVIPLSTMDPPGPDVVDVLCEHPDTYLVQLFTHRLVTEPEDLIQLARQSRMETRAALLQNVSDSKIANALVPEMHRKVQSKDLIFVLDRFRDLSTAARFAALTHASTIEIRRYFTGAWVNQPKPGEARSIVERVGEGWYASRDGLVAQFHVLETGAHSPAMTELLDALVELCPAQEILNGTRELARNGVEILIEVIGEDRSAWEIATRMANDWTGTVRSLAEAVAALVSMD